MQGTARHPREVDGVVPNSNNTTPMENSHMQSHRVSSRPQLTTIVLATLLAVGVLVPAVGYAEADAGSAAVSVVSTPEEMTASVPADVSAVTSEVIDPGTVSADKLQDLGMSSEEAANAVEASTEDGARAIAGALDRGNAAEATVLEDDTVLVDYPFALKRIAVRGVVAEKDTEGSAAAAYDEGTGYTIMTYGSMDAAAEAYDRLASKYGSQSVFVDAKAKIADSSSDYTGWGVGPDYMNLSQAKESIKSGGTVTIAVLDTGCRTTHEAFSGVTFSPDSCSIIGSTSGAGATPGHSYDDGNGHGTYISTIIASGTPSNVQLLQIRVANAKGEASFWDLYYGLVYASKHGARIYNLSIGQSFRQDGTGALSQKYLDVVKAFDAEMKSITEAGGLVITAAGNAKSRDESGKFSYLTMEKYYSYPATSQYALSVGALTKQQTSDGSAGSVLPDGTYSYYGSSLDLAAPGTGILGGYRTSDTGTYMGSGTSMAAAYVSALAADLMLTNPNATGADVAYAMEHAYCKDVTSGAAASGWDKYSGYGMPYYTDGATVGARPAGAPLGHNASADELAAQGAGTKTVGLYRCYDPSTGEHLYTTHPEEVSHLKGLGWNWETQQTMTLPASGTPVWRLFDPVNGDHHYTSDSNECRVLTTERGWVYDFGGQPAFYSAGSDQAPVYRIYNTRAPRFGHLFTLDGNERSHWLAAGGWDDEGIAWYALK